MSVRKYRSKSVKLQEELKRDILSGRFPVGMPLPTEAMLGEMYESSRSTVRKMIEQLIELGVLKREPNRGVWVTQGKSRAAEPVEKKRQYHIAMAWAGEPNGMLSEINLGMKQYLAATGHQLQMIYAQAHDEVLNFFDSVNFLNLDGVITLPYENRGYREALQRLLEAHIPVVCMDRRIAGVPTSVVDSDSLLGAYEAANYLIMKYERPVYYLGAKPKLATQQQRYLGYAHAMEDAGFWDAVETHSFLFEGQDGNEACWHPVKALELPIQTAEQMLQKIGRDASIFCMNDYCAQALYMACRKFSYEIGTDVRVVGFDDLPMARCLNPPLSTMRQPFYRMGYEAAKMLLTQLETRRSTPLQVTLPVEFVRRKSG